MRSLIVFVDMLGGEYLNQCNSSFPYTEIDAFLEQLGGTVYTKCYTPAPDTGRSSACMWTGCYPKKNHCDHRLKYPRYFMNDKIENIWKRMNEEGYKTNVFVDKLVVEDGLIPLYDNMSIFSDNLKDFFVNTIVEDNTCDFIYLPDLHMVLNALSYTLNSYNKGLGQLTRCFNEMFSIYRAKDIFDYIMIFSDHGFRLPDNEDKNILYKDRTHTYIQLWKKGDIGITFDDKLRSNMDICPTVFELEGWKNRNEVDGVSLLDENGHQYVLLEDHENFFPNVSQGIYAWGVVSATGIHHWVEVDGEWIDEMEEEDFNGELFLNILQNKMCDYSQCQKVFEYASIYLSHIQRECKNSFGDRLKRKYIIDNIEPLKGTSILLYGAGSVGRDYYDQIQSTEEIRIISWVDINYNELNKRDYPMTLSGIGDVLKCIYDYIIISVYSEADTDFVKKMLIQMGVEEKKIFLVKRAESLYVV